MVSVVVPDGGTSVRSVFCNQVHFLGTPAAAQDWLAEHPDGTVLPLAEAIELGRLARNLLGDRSGCC